MEFDDPVERLGGAVVGPIGGEVGEERVFPPAQGAPQSGDLGDWAGVEALEDLGRPTRAILEVLSNSVDGVLGDVALVAGFGV